MITKAIIMGKSNTFSNKFIVRIPLFNGTAGVSTSTAAEDLPEATLCTLPNADNVVNVGDVVYVDFEDNDFGRPVILGHLYNPDVANTTCVDLTIRKLTVEDKAELKNSAISSTASASLPLSTTIGTVTGERLDEINRYFNNQDI